MNAADFPIGHARYRLTGFDADGVRTFGAPFLQEAAAERTRSFLADLFPEHRYIVVDEGEALPGFKGNNP